MIVRLSNLGHAGRALFLKDASVEWTKSVECVWMWQRVLSLFWFRKLTPSIILFSFHDDTPLENVRATVPPQQTLSYHLASNHDEHGATTPAPHSIARAPRSNNLLSFLQRYNIVRDILPSSQWCGQELSSAEVSQRSWHDWGVRPIGRRIHLPGTLRENATLAEELGRPRYPRDLRAHHL